jgi:hypothetical protein
MNSVQLLIYDRIFTTDGNSILDEDTIEILWKDTDLCFPKEPETLFQYAERLIKKLHPTFKPISFNNTNSNCSNNNSSCQRAGNNDPILFGVQYKRMNNSASGTRWALCILCKNDVMNPRGILAHCLIKFTRNYCEIHEVCVRTKGYCTPLISMLIDQLKYTVSSFKIYCLNVNPAACMCYVNAFTSQLDNPAQAKVDVKKWIQSNSVGNIRVQQLRIVRGDNTTTFSLDNPSFNGGKKAIKKKTKL